MHWGEDLGDLDAQSLTALVDTGLPAIGDSAVTYPQPLPVLPQLVDGWIGRPGLTGHSAGTRWAAKFEQAEYTLEERESGQALVCVAQDSAYGLSLTVEIELHNSGVVRQRATLTNQEGEPFTVDGLELGFPVPRKATEILDMAGRFHQEIRSWNQYPAKPRPVIFNTWEAVYFNHDFDTLAALASKGAELGVERFVIDDGWFMGRRDDTTSLGDWDVDPTVWPAGLGPIAKHVKDLGMEFGLWFEPEMINLDSDLARNHPEWIFDAGHGVGLPSRYQHVLDLGHPGAYQHMKDHMFKQVAELGIDYIKWDHNRYLTDAGHTPTGTPGVRNQTLAAYRLMAELKQEFPNLEIECCASGGGRVDLGVLEYTDRVWLSDCNDPHDRLEIQRWTSMLLPPEYQGTHIGAEVTHTTGRPYTLNYRAEKALWGHFGIENNLLVEDEHTLAMLGQWIAFHIKHRTLLHSGRVVNADLAHPMTKLQGVVAQDSAEALYAFSVTDRPAVWPPGRITLPGLAPETKYLVTPVFPGDPVPEGAVPPPWMTKETILPGRILSKIGIEAPSLLPNMSLLFHVTEAN